MNVISRRLCGLALALMQAFCLDAVAQPQTTSTGLLPLDPAAQGYRVDNTELRFKEHLRLPRDISFRSWGWIDSRYRIGNLIADSTGNYERDRIKKVAIADAETGEVKLTPYEGDIGCFADGNIATHIEHGKKAEWLFSIGKYGEALQVYKGGIPDGMELNRMSCQLMPSASVPKQLNDGRTLDWRVRLRIEHGFLVVKNGRPYAADYPGLSPELQALMKQPFMQSVSVVSTLEEWYLKTPSGQEIPIPHNPGEVAGMNAPVSYVSYLDAYFIMPYSGGRPFDPPELRGIPRYARLLYPDGRVERFGVPDLIAEPYARKELSFTTYYTKRGFIWQIRSLDKKRYEGELSEGFYLDVRGDRVLKRLPKLALTQNSPIDGCTVGTRTEVTQSRPYLLFESYYINLCASE